MSNLLKAAFDLDTFRYNGYQVMEMLAEELEKSQDTINFETINYKSPQEQLSFWANDFGKAPVTQLGDLFKDIIANSVNLHSVGYLGHQVSPVLPLTAATSALISFLNSGMAVYEMGMAGNAIEKVVTGYMAMKFGLGQQASGIVTSGGTLGNLTALLAARASATNIWENGAADEQPLAILISEEAHYSVDRAARVMGLGAGGVFKVPADGQMRMRTDMLETCYQQAVDSGRKVICVVGCSCSTSTGAFDDLVAIGNFAAKYNLWFHIDGAHGGPVIFSDKHKHLLDGVAGADSIVVDFHKMMLAPSLSTALLFKNSKDAANTFQQKALYIYQDEPEEWFNSGKYTFECTKSASAIHTYAIMRQYGDSLYQENIDMLFDLASQFASIIDEHENFELACQPQSNIVCFRYKSGESAELLNRQALKDINSRGKYYIVSTSVKGEFYLRTTIMNPFTTIQNLTDLLADIKQLCHDYESDYLLKQATK